MVNSAYAKAAVEALVNWNGKSLEEAQEIVATHTREEIEGMCWAEGSVKSGFEALVKSFRERGIEISEEQKDELYKVILDGPEDSPLLHEIAEKARSVDREEIALDALTEIHDNWVRTNPKKIQREGKEYMHLPLELIGRDTVYSDYIFLKPVMDSMGVTPNLEKVIDQYEERQAMFLEENNMWSMPYGMLAMHEHPEEFYPALKDYPAEYLEKFNDMDFIVSLASQVEKRIDFDKLNGINMEIKRRRRDEMDLHNDRIKDPFAEQKASAIELERWVSNIDNCVKVLIDCRNKGENVYINFNGHRIYSCDVTVDGAYQEILGKTKEEFDKAHAEMLAKLEKERKESEERAKAKIPEWIEKGNGMIYPERADEWKTCVETRAKDLYHGKDLEDALAIMERLENGATVDETIELMDNQNHSGLSHGMVRNIVFHFSKRGPEFLEHIMGGEISPELQKMIDEKKKENQKLEEVHKADSDRKVSEERRKEEAEIVESFEEKRRVIGKISDMQQNIQNLKAQVHTTNPEINDDKMHGEEE